MINTVEMTNRFKGLDVVDRVPQELWVEGCNITWEVVTKTIPKKCTKRNSHLLTSYFSKSYLSVMGAVHFINYVIQLGEIMVK